MLVLSTGKRTTSFYPCLAPLDGTSMRPRFLSFRRSLVLRCLSVLSLTFLIGACSALYPTALTQQQRLAMFPVDKLPLDQPVTIRWNQQGVPWIEAKTDSDLAFTLGLAHAHLRLGQITLMRRVVQGRLSESGGPFAQDIDQTLRTIDFGYAAQDIEAALPLATRQWLQRFVDGLNWYQTHAQDLPPEFGLAGLQREPWTVRDVIAISRLAGTDVNWLNYPGLLRARLRPDWQQTWQRALTVGMDSSPSFTSNQQALLQHILKGASRSGSNAVAVSPSHSASGAALLAGDPHLGMSLPNFWLLVGIKSPSYHAVGFMVPGIPIIGLGRNDDLAWAGTNMRAAQSELVNVADQPGITERKERIATRLWFDKTVTIRRSKMGPIISDLPMFVSRPGEVLALRWVGHQVSDEFTAFLSVMKAKSATEFRDAFASYGVGGQNMLCATRTGDVCQVIAAHIPVRDGALPADLVRRIDDPAAQWNGIANASSLPFMLNPIDGVLASANNRPAQTPYPLGMFYPTSERIDRLKSLLKAKEKLSAEDLAAMQFDTLSTSALALKTRLLPLLQQTGTEPEIVRTIAKWDGRYDIDATGPVAFEGVLYSIANRLYAENGNVPSDKSDWGYLVRYLPEDLAASPQHRTIMADALKAGAKTVQAYPTWGAMHHASVSHLLGAVPVIGSRFKGEEFPVGGSRNTVMKSSHGLVHERHISTYGSQARQVCDLSSSDGCAFVLFGGEDGWLGSANYADQIPLWRQGRMIQMPLSASKVASEFADVMTLKP